MALPLVTHVFLDDIDGTGSGFAKSRAENTSSSISALPRFLILSSDGFTDLCSTTAEGQERIISDWADGVVNLMSKDEAADRYNIKNTLPVSPTCYPQLPFQFGSPPTAGPAMPGHESRNLALRLLRRALGGDDRASVSKVLTLDMEVAWIDDTSIVVQTL